MSSKTLLFLCLISFFLVENAIGQSKPPQKECLQRGYTVDGASCVFPDGSRCLLEEFNAGTCGQAFMIEDYCIEENQVVWDSLRCCKGLIYYEPEEGNVKQQAICVKKSRVITDTVFTWEIALAFIIPIFLLFLLKMQARNTTNRTNRR